MPQQENLKLTMAEEWSEFERLAVPATTGFQQRKETRKAFYAGAWIMSLHVRAVAETRSGRSEREGVERLARFSRECEDFVLAAARETIAARETNGASGATSTPGPEKVHLTPDEALEMLADGEYIHVYHNPIPGVLDGIDWPRQKILDLIAAPGADLRLAGDLATAMKHGLAVEVQNVGWHYISTKSKEPEG